MPSSASTPDKLPQTLALLMGLTTLGFMAFNAVIGPLARHIGMPEWQVGVMLTLSGLVWMLSSKPWGVRSDRVGAIKVLRTGVLGFSLSFTALALAAWGSVAQWWGQGSWGLWMAFGLMTLPRVMMALYYAAMPATTQSLMARVTRPDRRASAMALLGIGQALGMVLGPSAAALLARWHLAVPVVFGAAVSFVSLWLLHARVAHAGSAAPAQAGAADAPAWPHAPDPGAPDNNLSVFDPRIRLATCSAFIAMLAVTTAQLNTGFLAQDLFRLTPAQAAVMAGWLLGGVGLALIAAQMLVRRLRLQPPPLLVIGSVLSGAAFVAIPFADHPWLLGALYAAAGFGMGFVFPGFQSLAFEQVSPAQQGSAAGAVSAAQALGMVIAPLASTWAYQTAIWLPYLSVGLLLLVWAGVMAASSRRRLSVQ